MPTASPARPFGGYTLLAELTTSSSGSAWVACETEGPDDGELYEILRLHRPTMRDAALAGAFATGAAAARELDTPTAVRVESTGTLDGEAYVATRFIEGVKLASLVQASGAEGLPAGIALCIATDVLTALASAHAMTPTPLFHGEVHPWNILVGADGITRLVGFGVASVVAKVAPQGFKPYDRLAYAAPERVKAIASSPPSAQSDLFSYGVVLWELLAKQRLFASKIEAAVAQKVTSAAIRSLGAMPGLGLDEGAVKALDALLERDVSRRAPSSDDALGALKAASACASHAEVAAFVAEHGAATMNALRERIAQAKQARATTAAASLEGVPTDAAKPADRREPAPTPSTASEGAKQAPALIQTEPNAERRQERSSNVPFLDPAFIATGSISLAHDRRSDEIPEPPRSSSGNQARALDQLQAGSVLGRYEILLPIAQGGMASVWAARIRGTRGFQKIVALKTMLPSISDNGDYEQMFLDEARVAARLQHPNVAQILDLGEEANVLFIVMEWIDGGTLSAIQRAAKDAGGIPVPILLRIASQCCAGLQAAHELRNPDGKLADLVHRDISPANVLVSRSGIVKIVDFGIAKSNARMHSTLVGDSSLKGKPPYLSPEQIKGKRIDRRSDLFSLGALLYVLATGLHPFRGDTPTQTIENIVKRPVPPPTELAPDLPEELGRIILKALAKDRDERFSTAAEMQRSIDSLAASLGATLTDDDVGAFVRAMLGEEQAARAAQIDAAIDAVETAAELARKADIPAATRSRPASTATVDAVSLPTAELVAVDHESTDSKARHSSSRNDGLNSGSEAPESPQSDHARDTKPEAAAAKANGATGWPESTASGVGASPSRASRPSGIPADDDPDDDAPVLPRSSSRRLVTALAALGLMAVGSGLAWMRAKSDESRTAPAVSASGSIASAPSAAAPMAALSAPLPSVSVEASASPAPTASAEASASPSSPAQTPGSTRVSPATPATPLKSPKAAPPKKKFNPTGI